MRVRPEKDETFVQFTKLQQTRNSAQPRGLFISLRCKRGAFISGKGQESCGNKLIKPRKNAKMRRRILNHNSRFALGAQRRIDAQIKKTGRLTKKVDQFTPRKKTMNRAAGVKAVAATRNSHHLPAIYKSPGQFPIRHCRAGCWDDGTNLDSSSLNDRVRCYCSYGDARCGERDNKCRPWHGRWMRKTGKKTE